MSNTTNKFELVINLKTAKALGLAVSRDLQLIQPATDTHFF